MHKFACTILPVLFLSPSFHRTFTAKPEPIAKAVAAQAKTYVKGWDVRVSSIGYQGQTFQGQYESYQATQSWIAVTVTCQNTTGKREWSSESPMSSISAELIDTYGRKHSVRQRELKYDASRLSNPYELNESRTEVWLFDVPSGTQASQLVLDSSDENGIRLMLW